MINTITTTQKLNALHPIIKVNATEIFVYRLKTMKDLDAFVYELSAVAYNKTLMELSHTATNEPYSFLYVKPTDKEKEKHKAEAE